MNKSVNAILIFKYTKGIKSSSSDDCHRSSLSAVDHAFTVEHVRLRPSSAAQILFLNSVYVMSIRKAKVYINRTYEVRIFQTVRSIYANF